MPDKKSKKSNDETEIAEGGGSKRMIIIGVMCAVIAGGGFVMGGRMSGGTAAAAPEVVAEETEPTIDVIVDLDPLNVNLAGGHYLRLAVAVGLTHHGEAGASGGHGASADAESPIETAPASDLVLTTFSGRTMEDLGTPEGRESARHDLLEGLVNFYGEDIVTVLFTEFVMQ